jgi:flagellar hook-length control protein FliK
LQTDQQQPDLVQALQTDQQRGDPVQAFQAGERQAEKILSDIGTQTATKVVAESAKLQNVSPAAILKQADPASTRSAQTPAADNPRSDLSTAPNRELPADASASEASSATASVNVLSEPNLSDDDSDSKFAYFNSKSSSPDIESPGLSTGGAEYQNAQREATTIPVQNVAAAVKETEKQFSGSSGSPDGVVLPITAGRLEGDRINISPMEKSQGETLSYYDPTRSAEMIQNYREQFVSAGGQQLTLEMEPEEFGKLNIKVGMKKEEVSAQIITDNEATRQTLLKHSTELRQDLENQGLALGKFNVDVGSDRPGSGGNVPEWLKPNAKEAFTAKLKNQDTPRVKPVYMKVRNAQSNLSIFA